MPTLAPALCQCYARHGAYTYRHMHTLIHVHAHTHTHTHTRKHTRTHTHTHTGRRGGCKKSTRPSVHLKATLVLSTSACLCLPTVSSTLCVSVCVCMSMNESDNESLRSARLIQPCGKRKRNIFLCFVLFCFVLFLQRPVAPPVS